MISLLQLSESTHGLVLSYPSWTAAVFFAAAAALGWYAARAGSRLRRRWPVSLAVIVAAWAGIYVATFRTVVNDDTGSTYAFLRHDHSVRWKDAADIYLEHRGGGSDWQIVVVDRQQRSYGFDVAELSVEQRDRVMAYMVDKMPESAFGRPPELLKRRAADGARPVGLLGDQQI